MTDQPQIPTPEDDPVLGWHYVLSGYVARNGIIPPMSAWVKPDGKVVPQSFHVINQNKPRECRFAIAQIVRLRKVLGKWGAPDTYASDDAPSGPFVVWDLNDEQLVRGQRRAPSGSDMPPPPLWMNASEDGMLMKALSFYDFHP